MLTQTNAVSLIREFRVSIVNSVLGANNVDRVFAGIEAQCRAFITESRAEAFETGFNFSRMRVTQTKSGRSRYRFVGGRFTEMQMLRP